MDTEHIDNELQRLRQERNELDRKLDSIHRKIEELTEKKRNTCKDLYIGKWFFKSSDWWDDYDCAHNCYTIVYVKGFGDVENYLNVIIISLTHSLTEFSIETDDCYGIRNLHEMKEMTEFEFSEMDETIADVLSCLKRIRPSVFQVSQT